MHTANTLIVANTDSPHHCDEPRCHELLVELKQVPNVVQERPDAHCARWDGGRVSVRRGGCLMA